MHGNLHIENYTEETKCINFNKGLDMNSERQRLERTFWDSIQKASTSIEQTDALMAKPDRGAAALGTMAGGAAPGSKSSYKGHTVDA